MSSIKYDGYSGQRRFGMFTDDRGLVIPCPPNITYKKGLFIVDTTNNRSHEIYSAYSKPNGVYIGDGSERKTIEYGEYTVSNPVLLITCEDAGTAIIATEAGTFEGGVGGNEDVTFELGALSVFFGGGYFIVVNNRTPYNSDGFTYNWAFL